MATYEELMNLARNPHYVMSAEEQAQLRTHRNSQRPQSVLNKNVVEKANPNVDMHKPGMDTMNPERPQQEEE